MHTLRAEQTESIARCQHVPNHLQSAKIFTKWPHGVRAIKVVLRGGELQVPPTAEHERPDESERLLCPGTLRVVVLLLKDSQPRGEEASLVTATMATGPGQSPFESITASRFLGLTWLHKHLPYGVCRCWRCV